MFTGIVSDIGVVLRADQRASGKTFRIGTVYEAATINLGASISCAGCCLTVTEAGMNSSIRTSNDAKPFYFDVDVSTESLDKTSANTWAKGTVLNLERALKMGDELGGHMVSGQCGRYCDDHLSQRRCGHVGFSGSKFPKSLKSSLRRRGPSRLMALL